MGLAQGIRDDVIGGQWNALLADLKMGSVKPDYMPSS